MTSDPSFLDIVEAGHRLRAKTLTSEALTDACLAHIAARNAELRAFITVTGDQARAAARLADRELASGHDRGPLHGIPDRAQGSDRPGRRADHGRLARASAHTRPPPTPSSPRG